MVGVCGSGAGSGVCLYGSGAAFITALQNPLRS